MTAMSASENLAERAKAAWKLLRYGSAGEAVGQLPSSTEPAGEAIEWLEPVLVRGLWGRVGSTLLMQLLATSDEIAFDRSYPCENRCLGSLLRYAEPLRGDLRMPNGHWMDDPDYLWWVDPGSFGFEISGTPLTYPQLEVDRQVLHREAVVGLWRAYSRAEPWPGERRPRYYAEKYAGFAPTLADAGIAYRWLDLVRDPRDVWCSVLAFDRQRGFFGFGRREEQSEKAYLASFIHAVGRRLDEMADTAADAPSVTVRYEDLVADLGAEADRLGRWLGVELSAEQAVATSSGLTAHRTTASTDQSIGRWRADLTPEAVRTIEEALGAHLDRYGYPRGL